MQKPALSVVTCTYNSEKYLEKCLKSIESQTFTNFEHIFNDSYSSDKTVEIINNYIERNRGRYPIKFFQTKPKGIAKALNDAWPKAEGEIIHFLHSDDYYNNKTSLERANKIFKKNKECMWFTANAMLEFNSKVYKFKIPSLVKYSFKQLITTANFLSHENTFIKTSLLKRYGGFDESNNVTIEYRLWLRITEDHLPLIINDYFTVFTIHPGSKSTGSFFGFTKGLLEGMKTLNKEGIIPIVGIKPSKILTNDFKNR